MQVMSLVEQEVLIKLADNPGRKMLGFPALRKLESAGFVRIDDEGRYWLTYAGVEVSAWLRLAKAKV